ncbi:MAG: hypothetical protein O9340_01460 [Cyclobacteriaceae bacterium]|nr:hypothetical protein [Cyclobacteriaceae bacterium]
MILFRFLIIAFNVAAITFLVYQLLQVIQQDIKPSKRLLVLTTGILLLGVPVAMIFRIIPFSMVYFLIYPVVVYLFVYFIKANK